MHQIPSTIGHPKRKAGKIAALTLCITGLNFSPSMLSHSSACFAMKWQNCLQWALLWCKSAEVGFGHLWVDQAWVLGEIGTESDWIIMLPGLLFLVRNWSCHWFWVQITCVCHAQHWYYTEQCDDDCRSLNLWSKSLRHNCTPSLIMLFAHDVRHSGSSCCSTLAREDSSTKCKSWVISCG